MKKIFVILLFLLACKIKESPQLKLLLNLGQTSGQKFSISGSVTGLGSNLLGISLNSSEQLNISADGTFIFNTLLDLSVSYSVTISSLPSGKYCSIQNGTGVVQANVNTISINCTNGTVAGPLVGGTIFNPLSFSSPTNVTVSTVPSAITLTGVNGITTDGVNIYLAVYDNHTIAKLVIATGAFSIIAGSGAAGSADGFGTAATFNRPAGLVYYNNFLYITDRQVGLIRKLDLSNNQVVTIASGLTSPYGITTDGSYLYFNQNFRVNSLNLADNSVSLIIGNADGYVDGGVGTGKLGSATGGITFDGTFLYLNDRPKCAIRKIDITARTITTIAGSPPPTVSCSTLDGIGTASRIQFNDGIVSDGTNLFFTESNSSSRVRKITLSTLSVDTIAGNTGAGYADGSGTTAQMNAPAHITSDGTNLYFADYLNDKVRKIQ